MPAVRVQGLKWKCGRVWLNALDLKSSEGKTSVGSNPTASAVASKLPSRGATVFTKTYKNKRKNGE